VVFDCGYVGGYPIFDIRFLLDADKACKNQADVCCESKTGIYKD